MITRDVFELVSQEYSVLVADADQRRRAAEQEIDSLLREQHDFQQRFLGQVAPIVRPQLVPKNEDAAHPAKSIAASATDTGSRSDALPQEHSTGSASTTDREERES